MKKALAAVLAFAIMFSSMLSGVFAESKKDDISEEARALEIIGVLEGEGKGITEGYLAKEMDRITAAASLLKLRGLYNEALKYKSGDNFKDVDEVKWVEGRNIMAYVKSKGIFSGNEKGEFMPYEKISEASYYKVLLETLGYKQTMKGVKGDFSWEGTLEFAKKVGLNPSRTQKFTINHLAKATVSALKAKNKSGKVYIVYLIEQGKIDKKKAIEAGLYVEPIAKVLSAKALGNAVVEVTFYSAITKEVAEDMGNYSIEGLDIKSVLYINSKTVRITTNAQKSGQYYTVKAGSSSARYRAIAKVSGAPAIKSIASNEREKIVIQFDKVLDYLTATDTGNYTISGVNIVKAELSGKKVTLETSGLAAKRHYTLRFFNIKSIDGISSGNISKSFTTNVDIVPPGVKEVKGESNERVLIYFTEPVTKDSALDINNYYIEDRNGELAVYKAEFTTTKKDTVRLYTEPQRTGTKYEITVENITDTSKNVNTMDKPVVKYFYGVKGDTTAPVFVKAEAKVLSKSEIQLVFTDDSKFDETTLLDSGNYMVTMNNRYKDEVYINKVQKVSYISGKYKVKLIVDNLTINSSYTLQVFNISDEYGNILETNNSTTVYFGGELVVPSAIKSYKVIDNYKLQITFTKALEKTSAEYVYNYFINNNVGTPLYATYRSNVVTLEMEPMDWNRTYKLTIEDLEDYAGNVLNLSMNFKVGSEAPEVYNIYQIDDRSFEIEMSKEVVVIDSDGRVTAGGTTFTVTVDSLDSSLVRFTSHVNIIIDKEYSFDLSKILADSQGTAAKNLGTTKTVFVGEFGDLME